MRWAALTVVLLLGVWLDHQTSPTQPLMWTLFTVAGLLGVILGRGGGVWAWVVAALVWRLSVFPILVFSGFIASVVEWGLWWVGLPVVVYPAFLVSVAGLHMAATAAIPVVLERRRLLVVALPLLLNATLVSFTSVEDLTLLPDRPWSAPRPVPPPAEPDANPYLPLLSTARTIPQNTLLLCAGMTYGLIPPSPWASAVQGTLEGLTVANPDASSGDRITEHHLAYLAAHSRIGR